MNLYNILNSNIHSQTGVWERGRSSVGRVVLIPTFVYVSNELYRSMKTLYANIFCLYGLFFYANLRRDEGNPTYGFKSLSARLSFMPILFNGALENSTLRILFQILKHYNLTYFSHKIFFNVKINKN
jgi:hypothetical protein